MVYINDPDVSHEYLVSILNYDLDTGDFVWLIRRGNSKAGKIAGTLNDQGYINIQINGRLIRAHRLAWFYVYKVWPDFEIDHIDGNRSNNSFSNLREATREGQMRNSKIHKNNSSGYKGVYFNKQFGKFHAKICVNRKSKHLGFFNTPEQAHAAYCEAAKKLHGDFARFE